ncbi:protein indeterminate-domain 7-like [Bidens hawaiensis]|uniref:protein indeterminate-domain 7-like n=1 Tax=Bidens hawaiensis TaxID=980011 RepID=UPI00404B67CC
MKVMFLDDSMSNLTSASNEASLSSSSNKNEVGTMYTPSQQQSFASVPTNSNNQSQTTKKKRNLPGNPDPEAEVIAMSPKTLMATNRFVCEICSKGFQRDQNLQLHRRGHNLPWKLKQRSKQEVVRKKVYVCPEPSCVHHEPARALGDLTGIKKHYSRKHGEKKWKCDKCSKRYAVQSDWKAHSKICGTREYRCDCGTLFSRRDSFITHRAFCGALAGENVRSSSSTLLTPNHHLPLHLPLNFPLKTEPHLFQYSQLTSNDLQQNNQLPSWFSRQLHHQPNPNNANNNNNNNNVVVFTSPPPPPSHMSATALLQKAAQMGESMSKPAAGTNAVNVMSQQHQQHQHQSILSGPHQSDHMCAPTTLFTAHQHHASGLENLSSTDDNHQDMLSCAGSINAFQDAYFQEPFFPRAATELPLNRTGGGELTRDFLGLTGFPPPNGDQHFLSMTGLDQLNTSSPYHHQLQQQDPNLNQNEFPWHG